MLSDIDEEGLEALLRGFYHAYRERFEQLAEEDDTPVPLLATRSLQLVRVNGGRALHFFFTEPDGLEVMLARRVTRVHDIELWPGSTDELKALETDEPDTNREQVRRTADIDSAVYVHFVVYPEDGGLAPILAHVAGLVAEREVHGAPDADDDGGDQPSAGAGRAGSSRRARGGEVVHDVGPVRAFDPGGASAEDAADDWIGPDK